MDGQTDKKERQDLLRAAVAGDKQARDQFASMNLSLVWSVLKRFLCRGYEAEDLFQVGSIGLLKAIEKFDFSFHVQFSTYAVPMIMGEIKRYIRDDGMIKVSRSLKEMAMKAKATGEMLRKKTGQEPSVNAIAKEMGVEAEEVVLALSSVRPHESLSACVVQGEHQDVTLMDTIGSEENMEEETVTKLTIKDLLQKLPERERRIVQMRYFEHQTQTDIAKKVGVSQVQVSRLEKKTLQFLKEQLQDVSRGKPKPK